MKICGVESAGIKKIFILTTESTEKNMNKTL
jgi:hypothetical protein